MKLNLMIRVLKLTSLCCFPLTHSFIVFFLLIDFSISSVDENFKIILHLTYFN